MHRFTRLFPLAAAMFIGMVVSGSTSNAQLSNMEIVVGKAVASEIPGADTSSAPSVSAGPRIERAGFAPAVPSRSVTESGQGSGGSESVGAGPNVAMMGVGVAAMLVGSLVDGDGGTMISIGGGVVALIGLFRYLR